MLVRRIRWSDRELDKLLINAIDLSLVTTNNKYCDSQRKACRSGAINDYTQNLLGCAGAGGLIAGASGGTLALLEAGVAVACVGQAAYNLSIQIDFCDNQYKTCIRK